MSNLTKGVASNLGALAAAGMAGSGAVMLSAVVLALSIATAWSIDPN